MIELDKIYNMDCLEGLRQMEDYMHEHLHDNSSIPEWAHKLMRDHYGMKLHG